MTVINPLTGYISLKKINIYYEFPLKYILRKTKKGNWSY